MLYIAIVGFGNVGKGAYEAVRGAPDMELRCVVEAPGVPVPAGMEKVWATNLEDIRKYGDIDAAILCLPSRMCPDAAETLLRMGVRTADAYDTHRHIWEVKCRLDAAAKETGAAAIIAAGWDPGTDSIVRAMLEAMAPRGLTYTNFGPGMSMGHSVIAKSMAGVADALSVTIPTGAGVHRRMVYVQMAPGGDFLAAAASIKADPDFAKDDTHVTQVDDIAALLDMGHGVLMTRKGVSGATHNQLLEYTMRINGPALTGQMMASAARAVARQVPGCYTLIEIPVADMLPGSREDLIRQLV